MRVDTGGARACSQQRKPSVMSEHLSGLDPTAEALLDFDEVSLG